MVPAHPLRTAIVVLVAGLAACGSGDDDGDPAAFCDAYEELRDDDPFERLDVASPGEMKSAFDRLGDGATELARTAPADAEVQAERYETAVDELVDQLRAAGYDLRGLELPEYRRATDAYSEAAVSLENAAGATCD